MLYSANGHTPQLHPTVRVADSAAVAGAVTLKENVSIWYGAALRADCGAAVVLEENSNLQDNCVVHADPGFPVHVGKAVTVGHGAILHGCTVEDGCLIGMGAILLNGCVIGSGSMVAAGALVTQNKVIPPGSMVLGSPARVVRPLTDAERADIAASAAEYVELSLQLPIAGGIDHD